MRKLLENFSKEKLIDFILTQVENDPKFANTVKVNFAEPDFKHELSKIKNEIELVLEGASDYRHYGGWGYIDVDVSGIVKEVKLRAEQGHVRLAFEEAEALYRKLLEVFEYQEECEISDEVTSCLDIMSEIADKAVTAEDREYIFNQCIALSDIEDGKDYGADYEDRLLKISAKLVTPENFAELEKVLQPYEAESWRDEEFKLIRLEIIRNIDGDSAADSFIAKNLRYPKIREVAFDKAVSLENFEEAERLCLRAPAEGGYGVSSWLYRLYSVYEMAKDTANMADTAKKIVLGGDLKYYDWLKSLLAELNLWHKIYTEFLQKSEFKLPYQKHMEILAKEKEYELLLKQAKKHTEQIYLYGKLLAEKYPEDARAVFLKQINKEAEAARNRDMYHEVCGHISCFAEAGFKADAEVMINEFKLTYKHRPAFVDELRKIQEVLT